MKKLLRKKEVLAATGFKNSTLYKYIAEGRFPKPVSLGEGARAVAWVEGEVAAWIEARISARDLAEGM
ncbi:AlpA family transcriptional regulator [Pseudomonas sp. BF61]|uniref:helix-turn-helix transcriptional regulator n=1 Tax=Pseudomonas sp. BF61 TaxID=2741068 RepID=UPI001C0D6919|nr:AlpA family transcriptional regulator [Pseudomonas sp. BF61]MBU4628421.1 AlpA family transcriptional regulator [Pseudomonas sp. BF61]